MLIANNMLRSGEDVFLDDMTLLELSKSLGVPAARVGTSGADLLAALLNQSNPESTSHNPYEYQSWETDKS